MPVANVRNDEQAVLLDAEFIRKQDHLYTAALLPGAFRACGGGRNFWLFNSANLSGANVPTWADILRTEAMNTTLTGAPAALTEPNVDDILSRHGWLGKVRLGETNGFYFFTPSVINNQLTGLENHIIIGSRGVTAFIAFYLPSTAAIPGAGVSKVFFSKWNEDTVNQRAWRIEWNNTGGVIRMRVVLSVNGVAVQTFTATTFNFVPGNSYLIGFSFIASTSVTLFFNGQFETKILDDAAAAVPASIFASTANVCVARRDTTAAGTILAGPDAHYVFAGLSSFRWSSSVGLAFYRFCQPVIFYNSNLSGT